MTDEARQPFDREELKRLCVESLKFDLTNKDNPKIWLELRQALDYAESYCRRASPPATEPAPAVLNSEVGTNSQISPIDVSCESVIEKHLREELRIANAHLVSTRQELRELHATPVASGEEAAPSVKCAMCGSNMQMEELGWYCNSCQPRRYAPKGGEEAARADADEIFQCWLKEIEKNK